MHSFSNVKCVSRVFRVELRKLIPDILVKHYTMSLLWMEWMMIVQILDWIREGEVPGSIIRKLFPDSVIIGRVLRSVWWPEPSSSPPPAPVQFRSSRSLSSLSAMFIEEIIFAGPSPGPGPRRQIVTFVTCGLRVARRYPRYSAHLDSSSRSLYTRGADLCLACYNQL